MNKSQAIVGIIIFLGILSLGGMYFLVRKPFSNSNPIAVISTIQPTDTVTVITPKAQISPSVTEITGKQYYYSIDVQRKPNSPEPVDPLFSRNIAKVLGWPGSVQASLDLGSGIIVYDDRQPNASHLPQNQYNLSYFLVLDSITEYPNTDLTLDTNKTYEDASISVKVHFVDQKLIPFLQSVSNSGSAYGAYCQQDSDCELVNYFCSTIAGDHYKWFVEQGGGACISGQPHYTHTSCQNNTCIPLQ